MRFMQYSIFADRKRRGDWRYASLIYLYNMARYPNGQGSGLQNRYQLVRLQSGPPQYWGIAKSVKAWDFDSHIVGSSPTTPAI